MISGFAQPFFGPSLNVSAGAGIAAQPAERDGVQGVVSCPVATAVESVTVGLPRRTTCTSTPRLHGGCTRFELRRCLLLRSGGQEVAGSKSCHPDQMVYVGALSCHG